MSENDFLRIWGSLPRGQRQTVLTPPKGRIDRSAKATREEILHIIDQIAGRALARRKIKMDVTIVNDNGRDITIGMWSPLSGLKSRASYLFSDKVQMEAEVKKLKAAMVNAFKLDFEPTETNYLHLVIGKTVANMCHTSGELARLVSHEVSHVLLKHIETATNDPIRAALHSQSFEIEAEKMSVELTAGIYNLEAGLRIARKIYQRLPPGSGDVHGAFFAARSDHHNEGMRFSLDQANVAAVRAAKGDAAEVPDSERKHHLFINRSSHESLTSNYSQYRDKILSLALELPLEFIWTMDKPLDNYPDEYGMHKYYSPINEPLKDSVRQLKASGDEILELLVQFTRSLDVINLSKTQKMDRWLKFIGILKGSGHLTQPKLSDTALYELEKFIWKQSAGPDEWKPENSVLYFAAATLRAKAPSERSLQNSQNIVEAFGFGTLAPLLPRLSRRFEGWRDVVASLFSIHKTERFDRIRALFLPEYRIDADSQDIDLTALRPYFQELWKQPAFRQQIFGERKNGIYNPDQIKEGFEFIDQLEKMRKVLEGKGQNLDLIDSLLEYFRQQCSEARPSFEPFFTLMAQSPDPRADKDPRQVMSNRYWAISKILEYGTKFPLSGTENKDLGRFWFDTLMLHYDLKLQMNDFSTKTEEPYRSLKYSLSARFMTDPSVSAENKLKALILIPYGMSWDLHEPVPEAVTTAAASAAVLKEFSTDHLLNTIEQSIVQRNGREIVNHLSRYWPEVGSHLRPETLPAFAAKAKQMAESSDEKERRALHEAKSDALRSRDDYERNLDYLELMRRGNPEILDRFEISHLQRMFDHLRFRDVLYEVMDGKDVDANTLAGGYRKWHVYLASSASASLMIRILLHKGDALPDAEWFELYDNLMSNNSHPVLADLELREKAKVQLKKRLAPLLKKFGNALVNGSSITQVLSPEELAEAIAMRFKGMRRQDAIAGMQQFLNDTKLAEKNSITYHALMERFTESVKMQPSELLEFPFDAHDTTGQLADNWAMTRAASAGLARIRGYTPADQIAVLEYLMGKSNVLPPAATKDTVQLEDRTAIPAAHYFAELRERLNKEDQVVRILVANAVLAGPNGLGGNNAGRTLLTNHFLNQLKSGADLDLYRVISEALTHALGESASLGFAAAFESRQSSSHKPLSKEAQLLLGLFSGFQAPGLKLLQLLSFAGMLGSASEELAFVQDNANPLSYYKLLQLLNNSTLTPESREILKILGSGAINVVFSTLNRDESQLEVVSQLRDGIATQTQESLRQLRRAADYLARHSRYGRKFAYAPGLVEIVNEAVRLELDKKRARDQQVAMARKYNRRVGRWTIRSVTALGADDVSMTMTPGPGITARKLFEKDPSLYADAMRAFAEVEGDVLLINPDFANFDLHDGQVLIDETSSTITIIDPGQTVPLNPADIEYGKHLLAIATGHKTNSHILRWFNQQSGTQKFTMEDVLLIQDANDGGFKRFFRRGPKESSLEIAKFLKTVSLLRQKGISPPIGAFAWVFGIFRAEVLSQKVGYDLRQRVRNFMLTFAVTSKAKDLLDDASSFLFGPESENAGQKNPCAQLLL